MDYSLLLLGLFLYQLVYKLLDFLCISHGSCASLAILVYSPKKGNMPLLGQGFSSGDRFSDLVLSNCTADCMVGL